jgi:hypothetical protein
MLRASRQLSNYDFGKIISKLDENKKNEIENYLSKLNITTGNIWYKNKDYFYNNFLDLVELSEFY